MNTLIWIGIVLIAWCRPIELSYRTTYTETRNGIVVKKIERDYVKYAAWIAAIILIVIGVMSG
jgi:uncharacterized membrane protein